MTQTFPIRRLAATLALVVGLLASGLAQEPAMLKVGDPAPPMSVGSWIKGEPVRKFQPGTVYVVCFWATWSEACQLSIPQITAMSKKFAGKAVFLGIDVRAESEPATAEAAGDVEQFVTDMGPKMSYTIGVDGPEQTMLKSWMNPAGQAHIPVSFVVDQKGKIAWIGHPMMGLEEVVTRVVDGTFDAIAEAKAQAAAEEAAKKSHVEEAAKAQTTEAVLESAAKDLKDHRTAEAVKKINKALAANPTLQDEIAIEAYGMLLDADEPAAFAFAKSLANGAFKNNPTILNELAWRIVDDQSDLKKPDFRLAATLAQQAVDASKANDPTLPITLDTLGYALFKAGQLDKAIDVQARAISLLSIAGDLLSEDDRKEITGRLALFRAKKKGC